MTKQDKVEKVMHEWKTGTLTSNGKQVTDYDQAVAIALSEAGLSKYADGGGVGLDNFYVKSNFGNFSVTDRRSNKMVVGYSKKEDAIITAKGLNDIDNSKELNETISKLKTMKGYGHFLNKYADGGGVGLDNFDALDLPISYKLINNKGEVIFKTNSFNKASDTRTIKGFEGEGKLKIIATDKSGNQKIIADGIDEDGKKYEKGGNMNKYAKGGTTNKRKFAVGGEIGNTVSFKGDYGTPRSGVIKEKRGGSYIVGTDDGDRLVDSYEVIGFSETPIAKKKRFGFFAEGGEILGKIYEREADNLPIAIEYKQREIRKSYPEQATYIEYGSDSKGEYAVVKAKGKAKFAGGGEILATSPSKDGIKKIIEQYLYGSTITLVETDNDKIYEVHNKKGKTPFHVEVIRGRYKFIQTDKPKYAGGGEIENKIEKLKKVVSSKMLPESVKAKAQAEIDKLEKELHESKETKAEEKEEHEGGDLTQKEEKRLNELQAKEDNDNLNKTENSEYEKLVVKYRKAKENKMTGESEGERKAGMDKEARLDEKEELNATIQKLYGIESKAEDLINYQSGGIQGQSVDKIKKYVEYVNKEVSKLDVPFGSEVFEVLEDENAHSLNLTLGLLGFYKNKRDSGEWAKEYEQYAKVIEVVNEVKGGGKSEAKAETKERDETEFNKLKEKISGICYDKLGIGITSSNLSTATNTEYTFEPKTKDSKYDGMMLSYDGNEFEVFEFGMATNTNKDTFKVFGRYKNLQAAITSLSKGNTENRNKTTRKAPVKKAVAKKVEVKKEVEAPAKPKADHKKLVAKLKAKKGGKEYDNRASVNVKTGERYKRSESSDKKREAKPLGKRVSADGSVYYENRLNRADMNKEDKFEDGGEVKGSDWGLNLNW